MPNLKLVQHSPAFVEFCEGCGKTQEGVRDIELQSHTGRQIARTFLCKPCRGEAAQLLTEEAAK